MELYQLKYFLSVAQYENVSKAAAELHASQPSVSKAIRALEAELGVELLKRKGRNVALTYEGRTLRQKLTPVLDELNIIEKEMRETERRTKETIRLSVLSAAPIIPRVIREFKKDNPNVLFRLNERFEMTQWDLCLRSALPDIAYNSAVKLLDEKVCLAVSKDSPLAKKDRITLEELKDQPFINLREGTNLRAMSEKFFHEVGFVPNVVYESDTLHVLRYMMREGLGVTLWPEITWGDQASKDHYNVCLKEIEMLTMQRSLYFIRHKDRALSDSAERFWNFVIDYFSRNYAYIPK